MSDKKIIEEEEEREIDERPRIRYVGDPDARDIDADVPPRAPVSRYRRIVREVRRPSSLSILMGLLIGILIAAGVYYYYLGHRSFNSDISELRSTSKDAATTAAVKTAFSLNKQLNDDSISVNTANGVVTLNGQVSSAEDRQEAEAVAHNTRGVTQVVNNISITSAGQNEARVKDLENEKQGLESKTADLQTESRLLEALLATEALKGQQVKVNVNNQVATLQGIVDTPQQRDIAIATAQHIAGVREVKSDQLVVRYQQAAEPPQQ